MMKYAFAAKITAKKADSQMSTPRPVNLPVIAGLPIQRPRRPCAARCEELRAAATAIGTTYAESIQGRLGTTLEHLVRVRIRAKGLAD